MVQPVSIAPHMEVVGSDGVHVGTVDHMAGADQVKLAKNDKDAGGEHHLIPLASLDRVDSKVHLKQSGRSAGAVEERRLTLRHRPAVPCVPEKIPARGLTFASN